MPDKGGYDNQGGAEVRPLSNAAMAARIRESWTGIERVWRDRALAEAQLSGRVTELHPDPPRPLYEYGMGPDVEQLRRHADELREQLEDLEAHKRELAVHIVRGEEILDRARELMLAIREGLQ